ncbi:MAG: ABC transporter ATP-binding protein [Methanoregula sp.]|jgi:ATP-binding cassette subfamily B protein
MKEAKRLFALWSDDRKWLAGSLLLTIGGAIGTLSIPLLSAILIDQGIRTNDLGVIITYGSYMLVFTLVAASCQIANTLIAVKFSERTAHYLRISAYARVQDLSFANIDRFRPSDLLVRLTNDIQNIKIAIQQGILNLPLVPVMLLITIILIAIQSPGLVWLMVLLLVIFSILLALYLWLVLPVFTRRQEKYDGMNRALQENLAGIRVVKAYVRQKYENERFDAVAGDVRAASLNAQKYIAVLIPTMLFIVNLALAAIFYIGGVGVLEGTGFSTGEVIAGIQYLFLLLTPFMILGIVLPAISAARPSLVRIFEVMDAEPAVKDHQDPVVPDPSAIRGRVVFDHVNFGYTGPDGSPGPLVLHDISFAAEPGETIGFLGPTGSGKSTLVNLVPRFYDVTGGSVTIDGIDVRKFTQEKLREIVGTCLQQPNLFSGTIRENILFASKEASDTRMLAAAEDADAEGFVRNIPLQYDDAVARRGTNFSGGQRQRLAIARTLAANPRILILDDSTSACDVATEARIQDAINKRSTGVTKLLVAQRISTVIAADRIILLENGRIAAMGTHEELLATSPLYKEIYDSQLGKGITGRSGA